MNTTLPCVEINPTLPATGTVIWLHGLGADGHDFAPIAAELNRSLSHPLRFVFPHAPMIPVTINNGYVMRAWYDILSQSIEQRADQTGIIQSTQKLHALINREVQLGIATDKIILAGFSQGAVIALTAGLTFTQRLGGILALSGYLPQPSYTLQSAHSANQETPIFLGHGTDDSIVPYKLGKEIHHLLEKHQYPVSWHSYQMTHSVCPQEIQDIANWLQNIF